MSIFRGSTLTLHRISFFLLSLGFNKCYKKLTTTTFIRFLSKTRDKLQKYRNALRTLFFKFILKLSSICIIFLL